MGKLLELIGMQMQRLADKERRFCDRIGSAMGKNELCFTEPAHGVTDEIEQRLQFAGGDLRCLRDGSLRGLRCALRHQDFVQRAAAASSWLCASIQLVPRALSSCFQN